MLVINVLFYSIDNFIFDPLLIYLLIGLPVLLSGQIELSAEPLVAGREATVRLGAPDSILIIAYRPNSSVVRRDTLRAAEPVAAFQWTPEKAGVVALSTSTDARNVSVRFRGFSWKGLTVMLLAGTILFGGVIFAFRVLFREEESGQSIDVDPASRPDT
jgi:hypothetical protein